MPDASSTPTSAAPPPEAPFVATPTEQAEWEERRAAQMKEYGLWVAVQPIDHGTARAYNIGDPVPISNVERHGYDADGLVAKRSSKEGKRALGQEG